MGVTLGNASINEFGQISATTVEIIMNHTVYYYKGNAIRRWNGPDA